MCEGELRKEIYMIIGGNLDNKDYQKTHLWKVSGNIMESLYFRLKRCYDAGFLDGKDGVNNFKIEKYI